MNHIYRLSWNRSSGQWVPTSELAQSAAPSLLSRKRVVGHRTLMLSVLAASLLAAGTAYAGGGGPIGGQITSGAGQIQQAGNTTFIHQSSQNLTLNWQSFDVGANQTVDFLQPNSTSIAVNRIFSSTPSEIDGHLNSNGQVWLINPNGVLFGQGAQVNVGSLVASTLDVDNGSLSSNTRTFSGSGTGSVVNKGTITAANGGYVALLGNNVSNQGVISAQLGTVALAGGSAVTLTFGGNQLLHVQVDQSTLNNLVQNGELIQANGGQVIMTAGAKNAILASAVNNTGVVEAQTVENHNGVITLLGGMTAGTVNVGGTLDASAPNGGNGGSIETSAANFNVASGARITAAAPQGKDGSWLVDPTNLNIDSTAASAIVLALNNNTNVTETTTSTGVTGVAGSTGNTSSGNGDINVESAISWDTAASLTLNAYNGINITAAITNTKGGGGLSLIANDSYAATGINVGALVSSTGSVSMQELGTTHKGGLTIGAAGSIAGATGVTLATTGNFINQAGSSAVSSSGGNWLIYSTNPTTDTDGGLTPQFIQYNATYGATPTAPAVSGENGFLYSYAPTLRVTAVTGTVTKVYDGTTTATLAASNLTDTGLYNSDTISSATGTYSQSNVGKNLTVTAPSTIAGYSIVNSSGVPVYGYQLSGVPSAAIGSITPAPLTAQIIGDPTKVYDGTTTATLTPANYQISGFVTGQSATVNQPSSVAYGGSDAGNWTVTANFSITNFVAGAGTLLSNYTLPTVATGLGTITPAPVLLSGLVGGSMVYNGGTLDTAFNYSNASIFGVNAGDGVTLAESNPSASFAAKDVGTDLALTLSGFSLTGAKANDYTLVLPELTGDITPLALNVSGITANNKVYDATTAAALSTGGATLSGVINGDNVSLVSSGATGTFSQANVGNNLGVSVSGLSLSGTDAEDYTVNAPTNLLANITPAPLTISFTSVTPTKVYDGTTTATLGAANFNITGFVGNQSAVISQSTGTYNSANAASGIPIAVNVQPSDFTPASGTLMSNYSFTTSLSTTGTITPLQLTGVISNSPSKIYDGTTAVEPDLTGSDLQLQGFVSGQNITVNSGTDLSATYANANVGVWGVTSNGGVTSGDVTAASGTLLSNYILPTVFAGSGTITPKSLGGGEVLSTSITDVTKVYDGNTMIQLTAGDFTAITGWVGTDGGSLNSNLSVTANFAQSNVGNNIPLGVTLTTADVTPTGNTNLSDYTFAAPSTGVGSITPRPLTVTLIGDPTKVYNGNTNAILTSANFQVSNWAPSEGGSINPTAAATYNTADVTANTITTTLGPGNYVTNPGTLLSNYTLIYTVSGAGSITQAPLYVTNVFAENKIYDGSTTASIDSSNYILNGLVSSDASSGDVSLSVSNGANTGTFATQNVGNSIAVTPNTYAISGSAAANYILEPLNLSANISPAALMIVGVTANNKVYDGGTSDSLGVTGATLTGFAPGDSGTTSLVTTSATGTFSQSNVGNGLSVAASGFSLSGNPFGNYYLEQPTGLTANITPAQLTVTIIGDPTKTYDGSESATLTAANYNITGFASGQSASLPQSASASYSSANANAIVPINSTLVTSDWLAGKNTLLSNYLLPTAATGNGTINPYVLDLTGTRVYDATTNAYGSDFGTINGLNGDTLTVSGNGVLSSKNVGTYTGIGVAGQPDSGQGFNLYQLSLVAASGSSATASNYTLVGGTDKYTVTPATLTVTGTTVNTKTYNGSTAATLGGTQDLQGVFTGDNVTIANDVGNFASPNAGTNIAVNSAITLGGTDSGNYILTQPTGLTGDINPAQIIISGTRQYDAGTDALAVAFGTNGVISTNVNGEKLTVTGEGTTSSANVGSYSTVDSSFTTGSLQLNNGPSGALASNYLLIGETFAITPYLINLSSTRVYDTLTDANASLFGSACAVASTTCAMITGPNGETVELTGSGITSSKNVGTYTGTGSSTSPNSGQGFNLGTLALVTGGGTGDTSNYGLVGGSDKLIITPAPLSITGTIVEPKTYDATTNATLGGPQVLVGVLGNDQVTISQDVGSFNSADVGTGIPVTSQIVLGGADEGNYAFTQPTGLTGTISPAPLIISGSRAYNGSSNALAAAFGNNGVIQTGIAGQTLTVTGAGTTQSANVGTYSTTGANFTNVSLALTNDGNGSASNYVLTGETFQINPAVINLSGARAYDGTTNGDAGLFASGCTASSTTCIISTGVGSETLQLSGTGTSSSANVGTYNGTGGSANASPSFDLGSLALNNNGGFLASNYTLIGGTDTLTISPAVINLSGTREYNGTTVAAASAFGVNGVISTGIAGQTLTLTGAGSVTGSNVATYTGPDFISTGLGLSNGSGLASNYTLAGGNDSLAITPYIISLTGVRAYDGTTNGDAGLFASGCTASSTTCVINTGVGSETLQLTGVGVSSSANVGTYTGTGGAANVAPSFNLNSLTLNNNATYLASNYTLVGGTDTLTITPAVINLSGTREYDGGTDAGANAFGNNGVINTGVNGETLTLTGAGSVAGSNVGTYTGANFSSSGLGLSNGSGAASNYTLTGGNDSLAITPYIIDLTGSRQYNGSADAAANLFGTNGTVAGVGTQTLTLSGEGIASSANVGVYTGTGATGNPTSGQAFNLDTLALTGNGAALATNYTLVGGADSLTIGTVVINLNGTRAYDTTANGDAGLFSTTCAAGATTCLISTGVNGESIELTGVGMSSSANVGTYMGTGAAGNPSSGQAFNLGTLALANNGAIQASNYTLVGGTDTLTITPYTIVLAGTRPYDDQNDANASAFLNSNGVITGLNGQTLTLSGAGSVTGSNASTTPYAVSNGTLALGSGSGDASNYQIAATGNTLTITPYVVDLTGSRSYDGSTGAAASLFGTGGQIAGIAGQTLTLSGSGVTSSPNASTTPYSGTGSSSSTSQGFNLGTLTLTGNGATLNSNYTLIGGSDALTINPAVLNISGTRQYDGGTDAGASAFGNNGVISTGINGETITLTGAGSVIGSNVGDYSGANFSTNGLGLSNGSGLAGNYTLVGGTDNLAITPYVINLSGTRTYDGTTNANSSVFGNGGVINGVDGQTLSLSGAGTVTSKNVGTYTGTQFGLGSLALGGLTGSVSNYTLIGGTDTLAITPLTIAISATGTNRVYNGQDGDTVTLSSIGVLSGDHVGFADTSADFTSPFVGNGKEVIVSGITLTGADAEDYVVSDPTTITDANITGSGYQGTGVDVGLIAQLDSSLNPQPLATPYGSAETDTVGVYIGNHKLKHKPIERNRIRSDFRSGLPLQVNGDGVRLPQDASP